MSQILSRKTYERGYQKKKTMTMAKEIVDSSTAARSLSCTGNRRNGFKPQLPDVVVRSFFPEQSTGQLSSPGIGAEEVFVHKREPARKLVLLHAPQAPPRIPQLPRPVHPPHHIHLRGRNGSSRRLLQVGRRRRSSSRALVVSAALARTIRHRRLPRPPRRSRCLGRRPLLTPLGLGRGHGGCLGGRQSSFCSASFHSLSILSAFAVYQTGLACFCMLLSVSGNVSCFCGLLYTMLNHSLSLYPPLYADSLKRHLFEDASAGKSRRSDSVGRRTYPINRSCRHGETIDLVRQRTYDAATVVH
ncbi:hypothetical protein BHM03_00049314 [Ensete ventricosum]|nr:hypothetical protein BHM03_00049314 [Ensete ventricosum]